MKGLLLFISFIIIFSSCAETIYFVDANRIVYEDEISQVDPEIELSTYFGGDACDYLIFELDLKNNSEWPIEFSYSDIELRIRDNETGVEYYLKPQNKEDLIGYLDYRQEKTLRHIRAQKVLDGVFTAIAILLPDMEMQMDLDPPFHEAELIASYNEYSDSHGLLFGTIKEQEEFLNEWTVDVELLDPGEEDSWDLLFPRQLIEGEAILTLELGEKLYTQEYRLFIVEQKLPILTMNYPEH